MSKVDPNIRDQAYQFFRQESLDFLQTIEEGLLSLREDRSIGHIHQLMRAAHSIKGGAASVELEGIAAIAHKLEDVFRGLYRYEGDLDPDFESLLFQGYDLLRTVTLDQVQTGTYNLDAVEESEPIFEVLTAFLGVGAADDLELPTSAELGIDIVKIIFEGDVSLGIARLKSVLANAEYEEVRGEFHAQAEVFGGLAELFNLPGFKAIATESVKALDRNSQSDILELAQVIIDNFESAQAQVLAGDRAEGGRPSPELLLFVSEISEAKTESTVAESLISLALDSYLTESSEDFGSLSDFFGDQQLTDSDTDLGINDLGTGLGSIFSEFSTTSEDEDLFLSSNLDQPLSESALDSIDIPSEMFTQPGIEQEFESSLEGLFGFGCEDQSSTDEGFNLFGNLDLDTEEDVFSFTPPPISATLIQPQALAIASELPEENTEINLYAPSTALTQDNTNLSSFFDGDTPVETAPISKNQILKVEQIRNLPLAQVSEPVKEAIATPYLLETVRVDLKRLDRLSNLTGELVTQENSTLLQIQQLQEKIEQLQKRFGDFERITKGLEKWIDQSQKAEVRTTKFPANLANNSSNERELDPLLMDSYSGLYSLVQEGLEEVLQMNEGMRDMTLLTQQVQSIQRKKQQTLKQVRSDLLWSRMIPLNDILNRFPRMVRDLSLKYKKPVSLKLVGASTLIDKSTLEKLYDPLVHLIRNAFDHGADSSQERLVAGKSEAATIEVRAFHRGNQTFIEVRDDGRGIDPEKIKGKAIATGLLKPKDSDNLSKERIYSFLFAPSFSTADSVSELSGRGVGLSTVEEQVISLKGTITINSELGMGTTFTIRLPLTLTIAKLLVFNVDHNFFAIPVDSLVNIITASDSQLQLLQGQLFYRFQDRLIPIMPTSGLSEHYPLPKRNLGKSGEMLLPEDNAMIILLISNGVEMIGIPADYVITEQELVIKPFGKAIAPPSYFYGCTIVADGTLVPVIDGAAMVAKWIGQDTTSYVHRAKDADSTVPTSGVIEQPVILVIDDSLTARQTLVLTLEKSGYRVIQAGDGREALEQLEKERYVQAIFCDVEMPIMNGFEFLTICRKQPATANLPVIMLTSRSGQKHREIAKLLGANAYLTKPYLEQDLLKIVRSVLI